MGGGVVLQFAAGQGDFGIDACQVTACRPQGIVGFVASPADGTFVQPAFEAAVCAVGFAVFLDKVGIAFGRFVVGVDG